MTNAFSNAVVVQKKAMADGFRWEDIEDVFAKCSEELAEVKEALAEGDKAHLHEEMGDFMLMSISLCHYLGLDAHDVIDAAADKLSKRVASTSKHLGDDGLSLTSATLQQKLAAWNAAKKEENRG